jgi:hypothetical protein
VRFDAGFDVSHDAAIGDVDVLDDTVDPVRRVIHPSAGYTQHIALTGGGLANHYVAAAEGKLDH